MFRKILALFLFMSSYYLTIPLSAAPLVDLVRKCSNAEKNKDSCPPYPWYSKQGFDEKYLYLEEADSSWKTIQFPIVLKRHYTGTKPVVTYSFLTKFSLPTHFFKKNKSIGLRMSYIGQVFSIYVNGKLLESQGKADNTGVQHYRMLRELVLELPTHILKTNNVLLIKIQGEPKHTGTGFFFKDGYEIDYQKKLREKVSDSTGFILLWLYLAIGFYHLLLYALRRQEQYNLYFAILSFIVFVYFLCRSNFLFQFRNLDTSYFERLEYMSAYLILPSMYAFHEVLFYQKVKKFTKIYGGICILLALVTLLVPLPTLSSILLTWQISALASLFYLFYILGKNAYQKNKDAIVLLIGIVLLVAAGIFDILDSIFFHIGFFASGYAFSSYILGIVALLAGRFANLYSTVEGLNRNLQEKVETIEELNQNLEKKVEERTFELQETLSQVRVLKEKQDGDYFLTTLIIKPLTSNYVRNKNVDISFLLKQKKEFQFRKKKHEIGGDICIADSIQLHGKSYTIFVNGDAMGKSIQGAGGAIVLGVVFKSVVSRTQISQESTAITPEKWLKSTFIELQNVFESFDGSMLISVVMGIVDDSNGFMYYINAEHPWTALYRDGTASFIEEELLLHKLGISGFSKSLAIQTFRLLDEDVIFVGSDGRDDIQISEDQGVRVINEDEHLFLKHLEKGGGELEKIYESIQAMGEFTDDFSLLKITYTTPKSPPQDIDMDSRYQKQVGIGKAFYQEGQIEKAIAAFEQAYTISPNNKNLLDLLTQLYAKDKQWEKAAILTLEMAEANPWDMELFLQTYKYCKQAGKFQNCMDIAERLKIREPEKLEYMLLVAEAHYLNNHWFELKKYVNRILAMQANNQEALLLQREIPKNLL
ncbi:MAG: SpoIIE family protein phosphatase [Spirochaetota bacterium]